MAKFMLIGGGNVGRGNTEYETKNIDKEIVKMTEKESPNFLFIGLASNFSDSYYDTMKKIYKNLGCTCVYLKKKNILNNPDIVKKKIEDADIIYFCGGDSIKLINDIKEYHIDNLLREKINTKNIVFAGMSAGAILLSKLGYSDSLKIREESDKYEFIEGLNFLDLVFCPHYKKGEDKEQELKLDLKEQKNKVIAVEDKCAIKIVDNKYEIIKETQENNAFLCEYTDNFVCHKLNNKGFLDELK